MHEPIRTYACILFYSSITISNYSDNFTSRQQQSQLPVEFLKPPTENQLIIGLDCEGVNLSRNGTLCIMQVIYMRILVGILFKGEVKRSI